MLNHLDSYNSTCSKWSIELSKLPMQSYLIVLLSTKKCNIWLNPRGSGRGSVGRAVTSKSRGPWFKTSHRWIFNKQIFTVKYIGKTKINSKRPQWPICKNIWLNTLPKLNQVITPDIRIACLNNWTLCWKIF